MTDYNEFNWNEEEGHAAEPQPVSTQLYTENVLRPKNSKKKKGGARLAVGVICGALAGSILSTTLVLGAFSINNKNGKATMFESSRKDVINTTQVSTVVGSDKGGELTTREIARMVGPSVVGISCTVQYQNNFYFFGGGTQTAVSSGSGVIISDTGHIVTNYHVIDGGSDIKVKFNNGDEYPATLVGGDEESDLAVLKIDPVDGMTVAVMGDSDLVEVGDRAIAIGNPLGDELFGTTTQGIISGKNRTVTVDNRQMTLIQTDAAINNGNSGGALINAYGEVIGINSVKISSNITSSGSTVEGLGFAIPINEVKSVVNDLINYGYVTGKPLIGLTVQPITNEMALYLPVDHGLYVMGVTAGSAAEKAGIQRGDIVISFDGQEVRTNTELNALRDKHKAGDEVEMVIDRNGERLTINLTLSEDSSAKTKQQQ